MKNQTPIPEAIIHQLTIPPSTSTKTKTLVLDMDETMIHTVHSNEHNQSYDFKVRADIGHGQEYLKIRIRPHLKEFLSTLSKIFRIVVFTAGKKEYAKPILDAIDPKGRYFSKRLYRNSCVMYGSAKLKDLRILGDDSDCILVDNCLNSFCAGQLDSGIWIDDFIDNGDDEVLLDLIEYLEYLAEFKDMRSENYKLLGLSDVLIADMKKIRERAVHSLLEMKQG